MEQHKVMINGGTIGMVARQHDRHDRWIILVSVPGTWAEQEDGTYDYQYRRFGTTSYADAAAAAAALAARALRATIRTVSDYGPEETADGYWVDTCLWHVV